MLPLWGKPCWSSSPYHAQLLVLWSGVCWPHSSPASTVIKRLSGSSVSRGSDHGPLLFPLHRASKPSFSFRLRLAALILAIPGAVIKVSLHFPEGGPSPGTQMTNSIVENPTKVRERQRLLGGAGSRVQFRPFSGALRQGLGALRPSSVQLYTRAVP